MGPIIQSFFLDHLITVKGLRPQSVRSYRDTIRLLLCFLARQKRTRITRLNLDDLTFDRVIDFLRYLEKNATTMFEPGTSGWRSCTPCSTTSPPVNPTCSAPASG